MRRAVLALAIVTLAGCDFTARVAVPYCPVSDSAKAHADSVPASCVLPDSVRR